MTRLGMTIGLEGAPLGASLDACSLAESLGYTDVWSAEVGGADGLAPLAALTQRSSKLRLGTGIIPVFTRPPALVAMSATTMQNLSGGRFVLGLGTSSSIIVNRWMGSMFDRPLTRLREYVDVVRAALAGEKVTFAGETIDLKDFRLQVRPEVPVPIYLAAMGPDACRLAGEVADGVIFFLKTPSGVRQSLEWVAEGARAAGRDPAEVDCVIRLPVLMGDDESGLLQSAQRMIVGYAMVDVYNRSLAQQGFAAETEAIASAWAAGDRAGAAGAVSREMAEELLLVGSADRCRARVEEFRGAGVGTPVLVPVPITGGPGATGSLEEFVRAMAPGV